LSLALVLCGPRASVGAALMLTAPRDYQVVQRTSLSKGSLRIVGQSSEEVPGDVLVQARLRFDTEELAWSRVAARFADCTVSGGLQTDAGGCGRLVVRLSHEGREVATASVARVSVREVFVVAGQSNSTNHGEEKLTSRTGRFAAFDGAMWRLAHDSQLGAGGAGCGHPELEHAPLFLYGYSNGIGFSAVFPAYQPDCVWGWVSMRTGTTFQVYQPGAARLPPDADARKGPVPLAALAVARRYLGRPWAAGRGGYQSLAITPCSQLAGDRSIGLRLVNAALAADWQSLQRDGAIQEPSRNVPDSDATP
jgi:hypothetical protein